ncbi:SH3 domain-containing protein [Streptomyces cylindrosporus]|uniref:SH3 domain-containing protein n=1 Tax=Streptomyces cylindrosporus TaxID=2927583 RepID=A0ABS9YC59_9ACTN|nr:SH3 domain-containing protein [Streptomyces cylindrosporus]MCI3274827.1 SH3 domain-containing protein [Streptomyces cylindrosporus]
MRTTPALRTLAVTLLAGGTLFAAAAGTAAAATSPTIVDGHGGGGSGSPIWGTIVSRTALNVRSGPTVNSPVVDRLSPGSQDRVQCMVQGQSVNGNPYWYWLVGAQGWASAAFVDTGGQWVPTCADPCPQWRDGNWSNANWNDPSWDGAWAASASGSWSVSGSWSWSAAGSSAGVWNWLPGW